MMRRRILQFTSALFMAWRASCWAGEGVYLVSPPESSRYAEQVEQALLTTLASHDATSVVSHLQPAELAAAARPTPELLVTIGVAATRAALASASQAPILSLLVPQLTWEDLTREFPNSSARRAVVFVDQPIDRLILLGKLLRPGARSIGAVLGPTSAGHSARLASAAEKQKLRVNQAVLKADQNPIAVITPLVENSDLFLAIPDQAAFNRNVAKWILYLSFRYKIPVIGFSRSYAEAGALASVYSTSADIGRQGGDLVARWLSKPEPGFFRTYSPSYYQVETNSTVARSLGIVLPSNAELLSQLLAADRLAP